MVRVAITADTELLINAKFFIWMIDTMDYVQDTTFLCSRQQSKTNGYDCIQGMVTKQHTHFYKKCF